MDSLGCGWVEVIEINKRGGTTRLEVSGALLGDLTREGTLVRVECIGGLASPVRVSTVHHRADG